MRISFAPTTHASSFCWSGVFFVSSFKLKAMKVIEKDWLYGKYLAYDDVEDMFVATEKGVRVLPAPFFYDKKLYFELMRRYEPGEKPTWLISTHQLKIQLLVVKKWCW